MKITEKQLRKVIQEIVSENITDQIASKNITDQDWEFAEEDVRALKSYSANLALYVKMRNLDEVRRQITGYKDFLDGIANTLGLE
jgi:uncharacterized protein YggE